MQLLLFLVGLFGALGLIFTWPLTLLWVILLALGWGVLVINEC